MRDPFLTDLNEINDQEDFKETQSCMPIIGAKVKFSSI